MASQAWLRKVWSLGNKLHIISVVWQENFKAGWIWERGNRNQVMRRSNWIWKISKESFWAQRGRASGGRSIGNPWAWLEDWTAQVCGSLALGPSYMALPTVAPIPVSPEITPWKGKADYSGCKVGTEVQELANIGLCPWGPTLAKSLAWHLRCSCCPILTPMGLLDLSQISEWWMAMPWGHFKRSRVVGQMASQSIADMVCDKVIRHNPRFTVVWEQTRVVPELPWNQHYLCKVM